MLNLKDALITMRQLGRDIELEGRTLSIEDKLMALKGLLPDRELTAIEDLEFAGTLRGTIPCLTSWTVRSRRPTAGRRTSRPSGSAR